MSKTVNNFDPSLIFNQLVHDEDYFTKVFPHLDKEYFENEEKVIYGCLKKHYDKYEKPATPDILSVYLDDNKHYNPELFSKASKYLEQNIRPQKEVQEDWLLDCTEDFCSNKALYNALAKSVSIFDETPEDRGNIPDIINDALSISFDTHIGTDYIDDALERFRKLKEKRDKLPFQIDMMNKITGGGLERKTLNLILAATNVGKSGWLASYTAEMASQGYNVLYITMEMAENKVTQRIDANLFDIALADLEKMNEDKFMSNINKLKSKGMGRIKVKEYPTGSAHCGHFEALLKELKNKQGFVPDIVCLDYLNICASKRVPKKMGSYEFVKSIAEEFRALATVHDFVGASAVQGNRQTIEATDMGMQDTGESKGINDTADFILAMMAPEEIAQKGLMLCKQLKSRYADINGPGSYKRFMLSYVREKMIFGEAENTEEFIQYTQPHKTKDAGGKKQGEEDIPLFDQSAGSIDGDQVLGRLNEIKF